MIFKLDDYNAFLTSLFDKKNEQQLEENNNSIMTQNNNLNSDMNDDNSHNQRFPLDFDFGLAPSKYVQQSNSASPNGNVAYNNDPKFALANGSGNFHNFEYELPTNTEFIAEIAAFDKDKSAHDSVDTMNNNNGSHTGTNTHNTATPNIDHFSRFNEFDENLEDSIMLEEDTDSPMVFNLNHQDSYNNNNLPPPPTHNVLRPPLQSQHGSQQQQQQQQQLQPPPQPQISQLPPQGIQQAHISNANTPLFQGHNTPVIAQVQQHSSAQHLRVGSTQELNTMGTPLASPMSTDANKFNLIGNNNKETSVLDYQNPKVLTERASNITFATTSQPPLQGIPAMNGNGTIAESPPVSPLNTNNAPKLKTTTKTKQPKARKLKQENQMNHNSNENINTINHNPHPGRPRIKSSHNVIEQRYRNKINDKFNALQNSVPTLRILAQKKEREKLVQQHNNINGNTADSYSNNEDYDSSDDELIDNKRNLNVNGTPNTATSNGMVASSDGEINLEGLEPARKLNKGTILAKSIEYIKFLELKNDRMKQEHDELILKARMLGLVIDDEQL